MTDMVEVPIELIRTGNVNALRELLPKSESLFGRWAKHPKLGRGIILSAYPDPNGRVQFSFEKELDWDTDYDWVSIEELTRDPVKLVAAKEYKRHQKELLLKHHPETSTVSRPIKATGNFGKTNTLTRKWHS